MKRFNRNKGDNNDNFIQMETANKSNNREVLSYAEGIKKKKKKKRKEFPCFQVQKGRNYYAITSVEKVM